MQEKPFLALLDRDKAAADVAQHFEAQVNALTDMVNYGTNLVRRCYGSSEKRTIDVVVLGVLLKQVIAMLDGIEVLVRNGIVHAAFLQSRAALEASLYLEWILVSDSEHKANCYIVATLRHERMWALRATKGSAEAKAFDPITEQLGLDMHQRNPTLAADAQKHLAEVNRFLSK